MTFERRFHIRGLPTFLGIEGRHNDNLLEPVPTAIHAVTESSPLETHVQAEAANE